MLTFYLPSNTNHKSLTQVVYMVKLIGKPAIKKQTGIVTKELHRTNAKGKTNT